jgi:hypothetical protein
MPRAQTAAAAYLNLHKVATGKKRLLDELEALERKRDRILGQIAELEMQTTQLESVVNELNQDSSLLPTANLQPTQNGSFSTLLLEY